MTTLIAVHNSDGLVGRCDAKCYDAKHPQCVCICGGMNHGAGIQRAVDNTRLYADVMIESAREQSGDSAFFHSSVPADGPIQLVLDLGDA